MGKDEDYKNILKEECISIKWGEACIFIVLVQYLNDGQKPFVNRNNEPLGKLAAEGNDILVGNQRIR